MKKKKVIQLDFFAGADAAAQSPSVSLENVRLCPRWMIQK